MSADHKDAVDKAVEEVKETANDKAKKVTPEAKEELKKKPAKSG